MKPTNLDKIATSVARKVKPKSKLPRNRKLSILIHFDRTNGYDQAAPLLRALSKRHAASAFVRKAILDAIDRELN
jgi:hypothetical protein